MIDDDDDDEDDDDHDDKLTSLTTKHDCRSLIPSVSPL